MEKIYSDSYYYFVYLCLFAKHLIKSYVYYFYIFYDCRQSDY